MFVGKTYLSSVSPARKSREVGEQSRSGLFGPTAVQQWQSSSVRKSFARRGLLALWAQEPRFGESHTIPMHGLAGDAIVQ